MKRLLFIAFVALLSVPTWAQSTQDYIEVERGLLHAERKAVVAKAMVLTDEEAKVFWPLYNEYNEQVYKSKTKKVKVIADYADNFDNMTDARADEIMSNNMAADLELLKLKINYYKKFKKILSPSKVARYFQIEAKIDAMINAELAVQIPLIESINDAVKK